MLSTHTFVPIPGARPTDFDHGAWDAGSDRVFVAHTAADTVEVIDATSGRHERTLPGHAEAAGVVAAGGLVAVTNRGAASLSIIDAGTLAQLHTFPTHPRPNGVALAPRAGMAVAACIGPEGGMAILERITLGSGDRAGVPLPGRPRWCVIDPDERRVYCAIREPSMVLVVELDRFVEEDRWPLPAGGAHGIDLDAAGGRLFVACDEGSLVAMANETGKILGSWPLPGVPDATFFNPGSGLVHVAVGDPGVIVSVDLTTGAVMMHPTEAGAKTTALAAPDRLYVFLPNSGGVLELRDTPVGSHSEVPGRS